MGEGDTLVNAFIGAVVTIVLSAFLPPAPILGGGVAGYMQGGGRSEGIRIGAISGLIAFIPLMFLIGLVFVVFSGLVIGGGGPGFPIAIGGVFVFFALVFGLVFVVGLSALGGWLGNYIKYDTDFDL